MPSIPPTPENVANWCDLADALTPKQITELEDAERRYRLDAVSLPTWCTWAPRTEVDIASTLLMFARRYVADNLNDVLFAEIALPAGAVSALPWDSDGWRCFDGSSWSIEREGRDDIRMGIVGVQYAGGRIERQIAVHQLDYDEPITPFEAQQLAAVLAAAVAEINQLSSEGNS